MPSSGGRRRGQGARAALRAGEGGGGEGPRGEGPGAGLRVPVAHGGVPAGAQGIDGSVGWLTGWLVRLPVKSIGPFVFLGGWDIHR